MIPDKTAIPANELTDGTAIGIRETGRAGTPCYFRKADE
jgi:hypothetical protein